MSIQMVATVFRRSHDMIPLNIGNKDAIAALCRKYGIRKLDVFGSATTGAFAPESSDIDFTVDLCEYDHTVAERYLDLIAELEVTLGYLSYTKFG